MAPVLDDLAQLHVQALNGVGRVDDLSNLGGIGKTWNQPVPSAVTRSGRRADISCPKAPGEKLPRRPRLFQPFRPVRSF